ncbi:hypothetical protein HAX54_037838 [Datura stramonium]|uniref:Uncharacterized protein n=1 Tax=Datura stramonium TaxID=4076 RepID=A0ABS8VJN1_DATST|nr:hypothetical protein [Datura stramonium]
MAPLSLCWLLVLWEEKLMVRRMFLEIDSHHDKDSPQIIGKEVTSDRSLSDVQTPDKRQISPEIQKDIDEADHFIYDHPHDVIGDQNISDDQVSGQLHSITESVEDTEEADHFIYDQPQQTLTLDPETPTDVQNPTLIACDPLDPVFAVCNLNTVSRRDFDADEYIQVISEDDIDSDSKEEPRNTTDDAHVMQLLQAFGTTTSQMLDVQVKEFTDRHGLSPRGVSHFSPGSGTGPQPLGLD